MILYLFDNNEFYDKVYKYNEFSFSELFDICPFCPGKRRKTPKILDKDLASRSIRGLNLE